MNPEKNRRHEAGDTCQRGPEPTALNPAVAILLLNEMQVFGYTIGEMEVVWSVASVLRKLLLEPLWNLKQHYQIGLLMPETEANPHSVFAQVKRHGLLGFFYRKNIIIKFLRYYPLKGVTYILHSRAATWATTLSASAAATTATKALATGTAIVSSSTSIMAKVLSKSAARCLGLLVVYPFELYVCLYLEPARGYQRDVRAAVPGRRRNLVLRAYRGYILTCCGIFVATASRALFEHAVVAKVSTPTDSTAKRAVLATATLLTTTIVCYPIDTLRRYMACADVPVTTAFWAIVCPAPHSGRTARAGVTGWCDECQGGQKGDKDTVQPLLSHAHSHNCSLTAQERDSGTKARELHKVQLHRLYFGSATMVATIVLERAAKNLLRSAGSVVVATVLPVFPSAPASCAARGPEGAGVANMWTCSTQR